MSIKTARWMALAGIAGFAAGLADVWRQAAGSGLGTPGFD